jgi:hypothetical protein
MVGREYFQRRNQERTLHKKVAAECKPGLAGEGQVASGAGERWAHVGRGWWQAELEHPGF